MTQGALPLADWEALSLADRALLMAAAVRNGYTDIRSIKAAYANFRNQQQSVNRFDEGGDIGDDDVEVVDVLDEHPVWKALENIDYTAVPDPEFTKEKTGLGDIEWFDELRPDGVTYRNGYHRDHPIPGTNVVLYNPNTNNEQDIKLDALHGMYKDPTYDTLNQLYREAAKDGDVMYNAKKAYEEDLKESNPEDLDPFEQYFNNEADALLRNMFIEGTPEYIKSKRYHPYKQELRQWNAHLMPYIDNIQNYLETGERPAWINIDDYQQSRLLPELTVTNQNAYGGNLFLTGGNKSKKKGITQQELQRRKNYYRQQLIIRGLRGALLEAVLANMEVESTFDPGAHNDASGARGLMQWLGSRKPKSWSEKDQLDYIAATYNKFGGNEWLDKKAWKRFNETTDPAEAARLFRRYWERPERSSWNATDALFKNSKGSYLPQDVNDLVAQVSNLQYDEPKAPIFTEEDQRLLDTPVLAIVNPEYEDTQAPDYKPSALQEAIKLDDNVWRNSNDPLNAYFALTGLMNNDAQLDNNYSWLDTMMTYSPRVTPQQREVAGMYQLFNMTGNGGQLYHGLNFAAYGGNLFRDGGRKNNTISVGGIKAGSKANTEQCAKYSNTYLRENGYIANGNAWNQGGGSVVFSGYDGLERPVVFDKKAVEAYNSAASDNVWNNFDSNTLDKDSVYTVNMYYKGSPYLEEAFKNGTKGRTGTHTGYLKYENGDWYVVHNIHGKVHVDRFKNIQGGNKKYGVTGIYAPRTNNIFNRAITKLGFGYGGNLFHKGGLEDQFANTYLGIGQFPDYDSDFIATNNLQYLPYSQLNMMGHDPENIRIGNQGNQTMRVYDDKDATYLADANGNLVTSQLLRQMTQDYVKEHYGPMLLKAFLSNPDKYWDEYNRYRNSAITFDENGNPVSSGLPPVEKPIEPVAPEFWLLSAGASKAPSALNSVISPLFNMTAVDNMIDDVTPYSSWGNMMSQNAGGPEWAWDLVHPSFTGGLFTNAAKKALTAGADAASKATRNAVASSAINYGAKTRSLPTNIYKQRMLFNVGENGRHKYIHEYNPLADFIDTKRRIPSNTSYFFRSPNNVDILNVNNGRYGAKAEGNVIVSSGSVDGKFVSYGEPWMEFGVNPKLDAWYEFPTMRHRGPHRMATDWRGNRMDYTTLEAYDQMAIHRNPEFIKENREFMFKHFNSREEALQALKEFDEKWGIDPSVNVYDIYHSNQTVIPNKEWNFSSEYPRGFLSQPFWRYTQDPYSGAVQKELMMNWRSPMKSLEETHADILPFIDPETGAWDYLTDFRNKP